MSASASASASGDINVQGFRLLFKSVALAIQKVGQYVGIGIGIGLGEYQYTMSLLVYLNQWRQLYKKSANTSASASASASGNISIQCHHLLFKSVASAIQKVGQYVGIGIGTGLRKYQYTMLPFVI